MKKRTDLNKFLRKYCNHKDDIEEYKKYKDYGIYYAFCNENKLIPVLRTKFMNHLKKTIDRNVAQKFMDMMWRGKTLGECKEYFELTFDEVFIIMDSIVINTSFFGREVRL